jgi:L-asparaginase/N4-(beta-N-acetylglucosaminyl)-L-asparaginase
MENSVNQTPLILSTWRFGQIANRAGWAILSQGGNALDAAEAGCRAVEEDPSVTSVGFGGYPDAAGEVTLDALIMAAPHRCGAVACVRDYLPAISIARRVMEKTPHVLLVGPGAEAFAAAEGFPQRSLLTREAREAWQRWKQEHGGNIFDKHSGDNSLAQDAHDTIGVLALDVEGRIAGGCSTSGLPFKLPGRVGDSPLVGHGLYVDPEVGGAVGTGHGELIMRVCGTFLIVEEMRKGSSPTAAIKTALERINRQCRPNPRQQAAFIALRRDGEWSAGCLRKGFQVAVRSAKVDTLMEPPLVLMDGE